MLTYFGIRPTSDKLHFGHMLTLLSMFDFIIKNRDICNNRYYILLAEIHAEISNVDIESIYNNSDVLSKQILNLFAAYLSYKDIEEKEDILNDIVFIFQGNVSISGCHIGLTYKYLPLVNAQYLLRSPIFKDSLNKSVAFLTYPVLQAFDILLYTKENETLNVFVANDQKVNINICKDIMTKLEIKSDLVKYHIYDKVLYDNKNEKKMSKSLGNVVNIDDINGLKNYIMKHKTSMEADINMCPFYKNIGKELVNILDYNINNFDICTSKDKSCFICKQKVWETFEIILTLYCSSAHKYMNKLLYNDEIVRRYTELLKIINSTRSSK